LLVERDARRCAVVAAHKGGVIKVTSETGPVYSDTGPMVQLEDGAVLVAHLVNRANDVKWNAGARTLTIRGALCRRRAPIMTPARQMVFRLLALTIGRCNPNWLRLLIQKLFITGRAATDATFARTIRFGGDTIDITDEIDLHGAGRPVAVIASPDSTSIYVASSNSFQAANLLPVRRLEGLLAALREKGSGSETFAVRFLPAP
jgi:hypothetical protein